VVLQGEVLEMLEVVVLQLLEVWVLLEVPAAHCWIWSTAAVVPHLLPELLLPNLPCHPQFPVYLLPGPTVGAEQMTAHS
jgi:hypothetical protein